MIEYLALPAWDTPPTPVNAWVDLLAEASGSAPGVTRESSTVTWLEVGPLRLRGYVVVENGHASAINFELHDPDPEPATVALTRIAAALGWEIHPDEDDDDDDVDSDDEDE